MSEMDQIAANLEQAQEKIEKYEFGKCFRFRGTLKIQTEITASCYPFGVPP